MHSYYTKYKIAKKFGLTCENSFMDLWQYELNNLQRTHDLCSVVGKVAF